MLVVRKALKQRGISPKLIADLLTTIVSFAVTYYGIELDAEVAAAVSKAIGFLAGVIVGPGTVEVEVKKPGLQSADPVPPNLEF